MAKKRVVIADDSPLMRLILTDIVNTDPELEVVGTANNGKEALDMCKKLKPDVLTLDMEMPEFNGAWAVRAIMKECPTHILIVSGLGNTNIQPILNALKDGAIDYINKPSQGRTSKIRDINDQILAKIKAVASSNLNQKSAPIKKNTFEHSFSENIHHEVIVIGSSTGGPGALEKVVTKLPGNLPIPVVISQHMPANFVASFVKRLNEICALDVIVAKEGTYVLPGQIAIMSGTCNPVLKRVKGKVKVDKTDEQFRHFNNPSVDSMFLSTAKEYKDKAIGVILTGMGKDGGVGLKEMADKGAFTIGQDEKTCIVYGMPKFAFELGAVQRQVPINEIGGFIVSALS